MADGVESPRTRRLTRPMEQATASLLAERAKIDLHVFVAGPYIENGWSEETLSSKPSSVRIRLAVHDYIKDTLLYYPVLGEHRGTIEMGDAALRTKSTVVLTEVHTLKNQCHAVVMFPSSPGSFCELGAWSRDRDICKKMLIIADKKFEHEQGYVQMGVFKLAVDRGASLHWLDYEDVRSVTDKVAEYLSEKYDEELSLAILPD